MRTVVFNVKPYDERYLRAANAREGHDLVFLEPRLSAETVALAAGFPAVACFVNDVLDAGVLRALAAGGTRLVALRSAGFNNVDLEVAREVGIRVTRVPAYSPHAVAEHAVALLLTLNRKTHRAYARVREGNFSLQGLVGFDLHGKTVGIVGTGRIGAVFARIMAGFGCRLLASDPRPSDACRELGVTYVDLDDLLPAADIVALFAPLTPATHHLVDAAAFARMKPGAMLVNPSRGALIDAAAAIGALKSGRLGSLAIDVYEEEADLFFEDLSDRVLQDDVLARLLTFPNVLVTGHQGFFTHEALTQIAATTLANVTAFAQEGRTPHDVA
jgi:D-lactate dehydrogenase